MGISIWQLLIVLAIVILLFGAKRLRTIGTDLGSAVKGFKHSMKEDPATGETPATLEAELEPSVTTVEPTNGWDRKARG